MPDEFRLTEEDLKSPKKGRKKLIIISAVLVGILALGALGYFGWNKFSEKQKQLQSVQQQLEEIKKSAESAADQNALPVEQGTEAENPPAEEESVDEYVGWNTYNNYEIGYSLKYPADWTIKETSDFSDLIDKDVKYISITTSNKKYFLYFGLKGKSDDFAISDRTGVGAADLIQEGSVTVLGTNVAVIKSVYKSKVKEYFFPGTGSTKTADGKYYFGASLSPASGADYNTLNMLGIPELEKAKLILGSVVIIPKKVSGCASALTSSDKLAIKTWKTFKNDKYDYSFKYPKEWTYDKVSDKLINFKNGPDGEVFSWRSEEMTALGYEGWDLDTTKNLKVACQSAKSTFLEQGDERMIFTQFKKGGKDHMTNFGYKYIGASISSDLVEEYDLILKTVEFGD